MSQPNDGRSSQPAEQRQDKSAQALSGQALGDEVAKGRAPQGANTPGIESGSVDQASSRQQAPLRTIEDIATQSLEAKLSGPAAFEETVSLGNDYYAPVERDYQFSARLANYEAGRGAGVQSVANMNLSAGEIRLSGPVTFIGARQVLFNTADASKYEILPPTREAPQGEVIPFSRHPADAAAQVIPARITEFKVVAAGGDGIAGGGMPQAAPGFKFRPQPMTSPESVAVRQVESHAPSEPRVSNDLGDLSSRLTVIKALQMAQIGEIPIAGDRLQIERMANLVKTIGSHAFARLDRELKERPANVPLHLEGKFDLQTQLRLADFVELVLHGNLRQPDMQVNDRPPAAFLRMLYESEGLLTSQRSANPIGSCLLELNQLLRAFNSAQPEGQRHLSLQDILVRGLEGERGNLTLHLPDHPNWHQTMLHVRGEQAIRASDERVAQSAAQIRRGTEQSDPDITTSLRSDEDAESIARRILEEKKNQIPPARPPIDHGQEPLSIDPVPERHPDQTSEPEAEEPLVDQAKKDRDKRLRYVVKEGDTLAKIALKTLRDARLATLIYQINKAVIQMKLVGGRKVAHLEAGMVIWLPNATDIEIFRGSLAANGVSQQVDAPVPEKFASAEAELAARFGAAWGEAEKAKPTEQVAQALQAELAADTKQEARRARIESYLGPTSKFEPSSRARHIVRFGDTLKTIASRHPALNDESLWRLLAEINGISTQFDDSSAQRAAIKRGQILQLPLPAEIESFRKQRTSAPALPAAPQAEDDPLARTVVTKIVEQSTSLDLRSGFKVVRRHGPAIRVLQSLDKGDGGLRLRLEAKCDGKWQPVVHYEIARDASVRQEFKKDGSFKTIRIDLPPTAAIELAQNDIAANWDSLCQSFRS